MHPAPNGAAWDDPAPIFSIEAERRRRLAANPSLYARLEEAERALGRVSTAEGAFVLSERVAEIRREIREAEGLR